MQMTIPLMNYSRMMAPYRQTLLDEMSRAAHTGQFILKDRVSEFEGKICERSGAAHAVAVAGATGGSQIAMKLAGVARDTEAIFPAFGFCSPVNAAIHLGAKVVFSDVTTGGGVMDKLDLEKHITAKTRAIVPMYLGRSAPDMERIAEIAKRYGVALIEDSAVALGAVVSGRPAGRWGDAAVYSFFPSKPAGGLTDAGILVTDDAVTAKAARLRNHGQVEGKRFVYEEIGWNSRMDEITAGVLLKVLENFDRSLARRAAIARIYDNAFVGVRGCVKPLIGKLEDQCLHSYVIRACEREAASGYLASCGIEAQPFYSTPLHLHPGFAFLNYKPGDFPVAERLAKECLALPFHNSLSDDEVAYVAEKVENFYG